MAHLDFLMYAPPDVHNEFMKQVNKWKYECEGKFRTGKVAPFVSEIRFYDVRLPKQIMGEFLRDVRAHSPDTWLEHLSEWQTKNPIRRVYFWLLKKLFHLVNPLHPIPEKAKGEQKYGLTSWNDFLCLGMQTDPIQENKLTGEKREVL